MKANVVSKLFYYFTFVLLLVNYSAKLLAEEVIDVTPVDPVPVATKEKIGIFDLEAIHQVPLDAKIIATRDEGEVVIEEIRFTGRPGVSVYMVMTYAKGAQKRPLTLAMQNEGTLTPLAEARNGFVGISVCPPNAITDPAKPLTTGGPAFNQFYTDDPEDSWFYHYVVSITRALDYLETRPEVDMSKIMVTGYSTAGYAANLLHAIENRPAGYITYHGSGYYTEPDGMSGGEPSYLTRKQYVMYGPAAYASYGTSPLYICSALSDYFAKFDGLIEMYTHLQCPKKLTVAPNRGHKQTDRKEFRNVWQWMSYWLFQAPAMPDVMDGTLSDKDGKLIYSFSTNAPVAQVTYADVMYSFGKPGMWTSRTWHRTPATRGENGEYHCEIPIVDISMPFYVVAQIETRDIGNVANTPQFVEPDKYIKQATAIYPRMLVDFESKDDLYVPEGSVRFTTDAAEGKAAAMITPFDDGTIHIVNIETAVRAGAKELCIYLKGDGKVNTVTAFLSDDRDFWKFPPVATIINHQVFPASWKLYHIPLTGLKPEAKIYRLVLKIDNPFEVGVDGLFWQ